MTSLVASQDPPRRWGCVGQLPPAASCYLCRRPRYVSSSTFLLSWYVLGYLLLMISKHSCVCASELGRWRSVGNRGGSRLDPLGGEK